MKKGLERIVKSARGFVGLQTEKGCEIQLIKGAFAPAEAADILLSFLNDKIKFHTVKKLHSPQDSVTAEDESNLRIEELRTAKRKITDLVLAARNDGMILEIESTIQIKMEKAPNL